jgi:hypothetical protein
MSNLPTCSNCGVDSATMLVFRLHGEKGGPLVCQKCAESIDRRYSTGKQADQLAALDALGIGPLGMAARARPGELTRELLDQAVQLTHPDRHGPEQLALATMVTAALTALRPFVRSVPKVEPAVTGTDTRHYPPVTSKATEPFRVTFPCRDCFKLIPMYYCDECRREWEARQEQERAAEAAKHREYRARKKARLPPQVCCVCGSKFRGKRRDAKTCSAKCRVRLHRHGANNAPTPRPRPEKEIIYLDEGDGKLLYRGSAMIALTDLPKAWQGFGNRHVSNFPITTLWKLNDTRKELGERRYRGRHDHIFECQCCRRWAVGAGWVFCSRRCRLAYRAEQAREKRV